MPIVNNPDTVDMGFYGPPATGFTSIGGDNVIVTPTNGKVFGGPAQQVPGGLLGLMCPSGNATIEKICEKLVNNTSLNGVTASIELAGPMTPATPVDPTATSAFFCPGGVLGICPTADAGLTLQVPVKVHLHNLLLGSRCYIGSNSNPIRWALDGSLGPNYQLNFLDGGAALTVTDVILSDSTFAAPGASGCGGPLAPLVDPAVDHKVGLPSPSGRNDAVIVANTGISVPCYAEGTC